MFHSEAACNISDVPLSMHFDTCIEHCVRTSDLHKIRIEMEEIIKANPKRKYQTKGKAPAKAQCVSTPAPASASVSTTAPTSAPQPPQPPYHISMRPVELHNAYAKKCQEVNNIKAELQDVQHRLTKAEAKVDGLEGALTESEDRHKLSEHERTVVQAKTNKRIIEMDELNNRLQKEVTNRRASEQALRELENATECCICLERLRCVTLMHVRTCVCATRAPNKHLGSAPFVMPTLR